MAHVVSLILATVHCHALNGATRMATTMVQIQVQDRFGKWINLQRVANNPVSIKAGLQAALKSATAKSNPSPRARAVDANSGALLDLV